MEARSVGEQRSLTGKETLGRRRAPRTVIVRTLAWGVRLPSAFPSAEAGVRKEGRSAATRALALCGVAPLRGGGVRTGLLAQ